MSQVARYGKLVAHEGNGGKLAELMLAAADSLAGNPGCEVYLINRQAGEPDIIWVTEVWRSQADLDASIKQISGSEQVAAVMALVKASEMIELEPIGGLSRPSLP